MLSTIAFYQVLAVLTGSAVFASQQTVGVRGQLMCGQQPLTNTEVKLWDMNIFPDPDHLIQTVYTDSQGRFTASGTVSEISTMKPELKVYHNCNNAGLFGVQHFCQRKATYEIPSTYINSGSTTVGQWYDLGTVNMEAKQPGEGTHCL